MFHKTLPSLIRVSKTNKKHNFFARINDRTVNDGIYHLTYDTYIDVICYKHVKEFVNKGKSLTSIKYVDRTEFTCVLHKGTFQGTRGLMRKLF